MEKTIQADDPQKRATPIISWVLYALAALALLAGLATLFGLFNLEASVQRTLFVIPLFGQMGPIADLLVQGLVSIVRVVGIVLLVVLLAMSGLLYTCGKLLARSMDLGERVKRLEGLVEQYRLETPL